MERSYKNPERLIALDALRGLIMILMALDHASYFIAKRHPSEFWDLPLPQYQDGLAFLTRFVTHMCAPGFFFLMGVGMVLLAERRRHSGWSEVRILRHFVLRGLLLIGLQFLVENPAWMLAGPEISGEASGAAANIVIYAGVLYGLGASMATGSIFLGLSSGWLLLLGTAAILLTQILVSIYQHAGGLSSSLVQLLVLPQQTGILLVKYPLAPWFGLTALGMAFGKQLLRNQAQTYRWALTAGIAFLVMFTILRLWGGFGNTHQSVSDSWISFLNVTKYPPSLVFVLLTMGLNFLFLFGFSHAEAQLVLWGKPLISFGRTALFFYIVHLYLYGLMGNFFPHGTSLLQMYPVWLLGLMILYPICTWYGRFKGERAFDSVWRFF